MFFVSTQLCFYSLSPILCPSSLVIQPSSATRHLYPTGQILLENGKMLKIHSISLKSFELMDRVVFCKSGQIVPLGLFGTVIGIPSGNGIDHREPRCSTWLSFHVCLAAVADHQILLQFQLLQYVNILFTGAPIRVVCPRKIEMGYCYTCR